MISLSAVYFLKCRSCITYYISMRRASMISLVQEENTMPENTRTIIIKEPDPRRRNMPTGVSHEIPLLFQQCHLLTNGGIHKITERRTCINRRNVRTRLRSVIIAK